ncbi:MAG: hypothetical protein GY856_54600 [bacterium]|nr:hypothetical protein [bacterium]
MNEANHRERLRLLTGEALGKLAEVEAEIERRGSAPPRPGDVYLLPETAELAIEWAVIAEEPGSGSLLVVPADTHPLVGSADVGVPDEAKSGPLSLRCGFGVWLGAEAFDPQRRTGLLEPFYVGRAKRKVNEIEAGTLVGTALEREVDEDPEYEDWTAEVLGPARAALSAWRVEREPAPPRREGTGLFAPRVPYALAASFLLTTLGLGIWVSFLQRTIGELAAPIVNVPGDELTFNDATRGPQPMELPGEASHFMLTLLLYEVPDYASYRLEILDHEDRAIWRGHALVPQESDQLTLTLSTRMLPAGRYRILLYGEEGGRVEMLDEQVLRIEYG